MTDTSGTSVPPQVVAPQQSGSTDFGFSGSTAAAPPSTASSANNVLISPDQSSISQYVIGQVGTNPVSTGLPSSVGQIASATTIGQALQDFYDLSPAQLVQLETMLWDGGFYTQADGTPMTQAPVFGAYDSESWSALARALEQASSSGQPLATVINNNVATGVGAAARSSLPQAVLGGGNVYTIDLSNPTDVAYTANQIFQAALGRNATDAEVQKITGNLQQQERSQGFQQEAGHEQESQAQYGAQQAQRNTQYTFEKTPKVALGAVPNGPFTSNSVWAAELLGYMGLPVTTSNVAFLASLAGKLGGVGSSNMNPLGVVTPQGGSQAGQGGTQSFQSWAQSMQSTVEELQNGKYGGLLAALQSGTPQPSQSLSQSLSVLSDGKVTSVAPSGKDANDAAQAAFYWNASHQQQQSVSQQGPAGFAMGSGGAGVVYGQQAGAQQQAVSDTLHAGATNPAVGAYLTAGAQAAQAGQGMNPNDLNATQQPPNPGDQYINPVTTVTTAPASADAAAYQEATTGANRPAFLGNEYLNAYQAILSLIKTGAPS